MSEFAAASQTKAALAGIVTLGRSATGVSAVNGQGQGQGVPVAAGTAAASGSKDLSLRPGGWTILPPAARARVRLRHAALAWSLVVCVAVPVLVSAWYLWARAADQYASLTAFSVRRDDGLALAGALGGFAALAGPASPDSDILSAYLDSQDLVARLDGDLDLAALWSRASGDPVYAYDAPGTIESLVDYWRDMVDVRVDTRSQLIEVEVRAFSPEDAQAIAAAVLTASGELIDRLNDRAEADGLRLSEDEVRLAWDRLAAARGALSDFRRRAAIVDPGAELAAHGGLVAVMEAELAQARIRLAMLEEATAEGDPRLPEARRRVRAVEAQLGRERAAMGGPETEVASQDKPAPRYPDLLAEHEALQIDRQFAEETYRAARAARDIAIAQSRRKERYLEPHILPTVAESARYPMRGSILALIAGFAVGLWALAVLVFYSLRDRR